MRCLAQGARAHVPLRAGPQTWASRAEWTWVASLRQVSGSYTGNACVAAGHAAWPATEVGKLHTPAKRSSQAHKAHACLQGPAQQPHLPPCSPGGQQLGVAALMRSHSLLQLQ